MTTLTFEAAPKFDAVEPHPSVLERCTTERNFVWNLLRWLKAEGFEPADVDDEGDELVTFDQPADPIKVMEAIFAVDYSTLLVQKTDRRYGVVIVLGNGAECCADWSSPDDGGEGFPVLMDAYHDWWEEQGQ